VRKQANELGGIIYDATCPLVTKVHKEVIHKQKQNTTRETNKIDNTIHTKTTCVKSKLEIALEIS
jgi:4-hydroxy-3-methylbut-2-enyl diphosphate reductase IspH